MSDDLPDWLLDAKLREVPLPAQLLARLREATVPNDAELDAALKGVPLPFAFQERLQRAADDAVLDDLLSAVPLPAGLLARLRVIPEIRTRRPWLRAATAACLMLVLFSAHALSLGALVAWVRPAPPPAAPFPVIDLGPLRLTAGETVPVALDAAPRRRRPPTAAPPAPPARGLDVRLVHLDGVVPPGPAGQLLEQVQQGWKADGDVLLMRWGPLGAPHFESARLPDFERAARPQARGVELPLVREAAPYRTFLLRSGSHPPIVPAAAARLATSIVPLRVDTSSVERTRQLAAARRLPDAEEVRVEDFLAAVDYHFADPPPERLGIRTAAGPALFGRQERGLLQVGVKAGPVRRRHEACHLTVALDVSSSMNWEGGLEMVRQALRRFGRQLGQRDYLSVVMFDHDLVREVQLLRGDQLEALLAVIDELPARGGDNLPLGLQHAASLALNSGLGDDTVSRLALITDGQAPLSRDEAGQLRELLEVAAAGGVQTTVVQIGRRPREAPQLDALAAAGGGARVPAASADQAAWALAECLTGASSLVAQRATLRVEFNPQAVLAYRLVGHGTTPLTALASLDAPADLHAGQEATVLYEVWLQAGSHDEVAWAEVRWQDPGDGAARRTARQRISRLQFATSLGESALSLQAAAVAAEAGQILGQGFDFELDAAGGFRPRRKTRDVRPLLRAAGRLNPRLDAWHEFQRLLTLLQEVDQIRRNQDS